MSFDLKALSYQDFETLVAMLLTRAGFHVTGYNASGVRGPDITATAPTGEIVFVEVKHFQRPITVASIAGFVDDIELYRESYPGARGLIVFSGPLSPQAAALIASRPGLEYWAGDEVARRLRQYADLVAIISAAGTALGSLRALVAQVTKLQTVVPESVKFVERLKAIDPGDRDWRLYEHWCTEILTEIFRPDLGPPDTQVRSDDELDIMDAIFPIRSNAPPWSLVRSEYETRFVIAEFKNSAKKIGQKQVESIAQYFWPKAKRMFGILVSRQGSNDSAIAQRRRFWLDHDKMIVMLTDADLIEMLQMREGNEQPFDIIDAQLEEFLRTLSR
ncbi:restriction endonuclease [Rhizobium leguminosarum]|nr:restriction endonuclease [Rhizobium leguminosarum]MBY5792940.1 restriction endonuclease [Rhizobium leguminosarum]